jgi:hypothetical protein
MNSTHVRHALLGALLLGGAMAAPSLQLTSRDADASAGAQEPATQDAVALKPAPVVSGVVRFKGELPEKKPLKIEDQQATGCCPPGTKVDSTDPSFLVDEKNGLANVVVTVTVPGVEVKVPEAAFELDQRGCVFAPHVQVVP